MRRAAGAALVVAALQLGGCAAPAGDAGPPAGAAQAAQAGITEADARGAGPVILSVSSGRPIPVAEWTRQLRQAPVVLLGEIHDNRRQHVLRARLLRIWAGSSADIGSHRDATRPAIVFEFFDRQRRAGLLELTDRPPADRPGLATLLDAAGFDRVSWGWPVHEPLFEAAREADASWIAAGIFRPMAPPGGSPAVPDRADRERLEAIIAAADWPATAATTLDRALIDGHCGRLPEQALPAMVRFQRSRDASLAQPVLDGPPGRRTLILAGNGHVGRSHGVPRYLGPLASRAISVGFVERAPGELPAPDDRDRAEFDWIVLTEAVPDRGDPCAGFNPPAPKQTPAR